MLDEIDPAAIADPTARALIIQLLNVVNQQAGQLRAALDEIQRLRDEIARLKGEQGRPKINPQAPRPPRRSPPKPNATPPKSASRTANRRI
jgi:hypothetical protein